MGIDYRELLIENATDLAFSASFILGIVVGRFYKTLGDPDKKRMYGAGIGLLICIMICGTHAIHTAFMLCGNIIILKTCNKRHIHQVSLGYTWMYLLYLRYYVNTNTYMRWLYQTIALRLVGMAFEMRIKAQKTGFYDRIERSVKIVDIYEAPDPTGIDIISYTYFFVGIHKGPYYRWKIYYDYINSNVPVPVDPTATTALTLIQAVAYAVAYELISLNYSPQAYSQDSFYTKYNSDYRYLYNLPVLALVFCKYQMVMLVLSCACNECSFGWYPDITQPVPGYGPTKHLHSHLNVTSNSEKQVNHKYTFSMMKCFDNQKVIMGPKMKDTMRGWDMSTRYWYWAYIYKNGVDAGKEVRMMFSFFVYAIWCGASVNQFISSFTLWTYVHLEHEYDELYDTKAPSMQLAWNIGFSLMRMFCLIYLTPCIVIEQPYLLFKYYYSIYWGFHVVLLLSMILSIFLHKFRAPYTRAVLIPSRTPTAFNQ